MPRGGEISKTRTRIVASAAALMLSVGAGVVASAGPSAATGVTVSASAQHQASYRYCATKADFARVVVASRTRDHSGHWMSSVRIILHNHGSEFWESKNALIKV